MSRNPFEYSLRDGTVVQTCDAIGRCEAVSEFGITECLDALAVPGLQGSVKTAIQRRLRALDRAGQNKHG